MISLEGMYDLHVHPAPSVQKRTFTALEGVRSAAEEKMAGLVLKDHTYNTVAMTRTINETGFSTKAFGAIMLNEAVGGLNPSVVEIALALGTKMIELPTYSSKGHYDQYGDDQKIFPYKKRIKPIYILDSHGRLVPELEEIIDLVKGSDAFLASGHISRAEADVLVRRVKETGCKLLFVGVSTDMPDHPVDAQKQWASDHVFMEHVYGALTDMPHRKTPISTIVAQIRTVGAERCVLGTDAGSIKLPRQVESMKEFLTLLLDAGITEKEIDLMARQNPGNLLGIG
ncbi:MAG: hypothetical protein A4E65_03209 [Syntrophorhabdus sp. PtaU1.Bin153]|nr:MAG: hypothetical protein A4E65_03209 [Syntrophorhabdus sp. PtaU1.Bin153]